MPGCATWWYGSPRSCSSLCGEKLLPRGTDCGAGAWMMEPMKKPRRCITVLYANTPGVTFDFDYYLQKHATLIHRLYGASIDRLELRRGAATPLGTPAPYIAVINIWIADQDAFDAAGAQHEATLIADVPNFTNTMPVIQIDEIVE